jgi:hypothetical protein
MTQLPLVVAKVLQQWRFEPRTGFDDMTPHRELAIRPATPCKVKVTRRAGLLPKKPH